MFAPSLLRLAFIASALCVGLLAGCTTSRHRDVAFSGAAPNAAKKTGADVQPWYLIHDEGKKPSRVLYYAQEGVGNNHQFTRNVNVQIVYESASEADSVYKKLGVNCHEKNYLETMHGAVYRDNRASGGVKSSLPQPIIAAWQTQVYRFACGATAQRTLQNGFARLGPLPDRNLVELSWQIAWKDGTRPPYATPRKTPPPPPQDRLQKDAQAGVEAYFETAVEASRRRAKTPNLRLETWIGATHDQIIQDWGRTYDAKTDSDGDNLLTYLYDDSSALVASSTRGPVISGVTRRCWVTWRIHAGVVTTYDWKNEGARNINVCKSMHIGSGPFPEKEKVSRK